MRLALQRYFPLFVLLGIVVNATGLFNPILEPDGVLYATIAKHIAVSHDWINLIGDGHDWLDKPHFPFWITAISFKIFGINSFAYKFPAFVFWLIGVRYTFLLAKKIYDDLIAKVTVIIYVFALHAILANFDVRAEPYLTSLTIAAIYYLYFVYKNGKLWPVVLASIFSACAIMTKGIFALLTIGGGFVIHWLITKQWKQFLNFRWYVFVILTFILIFPELYCLYVQFDIHPEKVVFGTTHVSGIKFFFWDSQFGRFFNTGPIKGKGDISFFLHTTLWAFLPWSILFYIAVFRLFLRKTIVTNKEQWIIFGSAALTFLLFSFSRFQLPHYVIIIFPLFSMITANYLVTMFEKQNPKSLQIISTIQTILLFIVAALVIFLCLFAAVPGAIAIVVFSVVLLAAGLFIKKHDVFISIFMKAAAFSFILFFFLNFFFYPFLMRYTSGMQAANWLKKNNYTQPTAMYKNFAYSFEFYNKNEPVRLNTTKDLQQFVATNKDCIVYTNTENADSLQQAGFNLKTIQEFQYFRISMLTGTFLNPKTRDKSTTKVSLLEISNK